MKHITQILIILISTINFSQDSISEILKKYNTNSVPYMSVQELAMPKTKAFILDAREIEEYKTSHIKNAIHAGYNLFDIKTVLNAIKNKNEDVVVYCSIGIRSEDIAEKIKKAGYSNVYNLYGGIFEWKNNGFLVYTSNFNETENIHVFSEEWSPLLVKGQKVYE